MQTAKYIKGLAPVIICMFMAVTLAGCLPRLDPGPPPVRMRLAPAMPGPAAGKPSSQQLTVVAPSLAHDIDTDRIALLFNNREIRYLAGARWASPLSSLMYSSLVQAMEASGAFAGVGDELAGLASQRKLGSEITVFTLEYATESGAPVAHFSGLFRLLNTLDAKVVGTQKVDVKIPVAATDNAALVRALEMALEKGLAEVAAWIEGIS